MKITQVTGTAIPLPGDDIDTDRIIPARFLRCVTFDGLGEHAFEDDKQQDPDHVFNKPQYQDASILVAAANFGCGSSREHAPQSLSKWGIQGIIAESFAEIFFGNCQALGIPCITVSREDREILQDAIRQNPDLRLTLDVSTAKIHYEDEIMDGHIPEGTKSSLTAGTWNATMVLIQAESEVEGVYAALPYTGNFA